MKVISDRQVLHRASTSGIVITRVQVVEVEGKQFDVNFWSDFTTGRLHHITSEPNGKPCAA